MTPEEIILHKHLVTSNQAMNSAAWSEVSAALRDRAFFSSRVESVSFLETCRTRIAEMLANKPNTEGAITSRAQVVSDIMRAARESGIAQGTERLTNPGSMFWANAIIDTNAGMAAGYATAIQSNSYGARLAFPAQELVRIEERQVPQSWQKIWRSHGGKIYPGGRMIALKEDPIWSAIRSSRSTGRLSGAANSSSANHQVRKHDHDRHVLQDEADVIKEETDTWALLRLS